MMQCAYKYFEYTYGTYVCDSDQCVSEKIAHNQMVNKRAGVCQAFERNVRNDRTMQHARSDLMNLSKALLSSNDISSLMRFLNNDDLSFVQVERVNIILNSDLNSSPMLYYFDKEKELQCYQYNKNSLLLNHIESDEYTHLVSGEDLFLSYPQLIDHSAYYGINNYCKVPLISACKQLGSIEFINIELKDTDYSKKQFKLFTNMVTSMVEHIIEHEQAYNIAQQLSDERNIFQMLVDVTNAVISRSTKKELMTSLSKCLYQHFSIRDLSLIQSHEGHYSQHSCSYSQGKIEYSNHFFTNDDAIKDAVEKNKAVVLSTQTIQQLSLESNVPFFPASAKNACIVPMDFRHNAIGYICYIQREDKPYPPEAVELFFQISARVALAMHSMKQYDAKSKIIPKTDYISIEESYMEHAIFDDIISQSEVMNKILDQVAMVADCDSTVLILGESGTGKELIAQAIHKLSSRSNNRMVKMNCAAVPVGLFESELFGHERGAFTGAISQRVGRFEQAHKGTLFLDEIGDMPLELQPKLLRALQESEIERIGKNHLISVDVRIVVATNANLLSMVNGKDFRGDLYYRLNVFPITIPPLRERPEDIPLLVKHFTRVLSRKMGKDITAIAAETLEVLSNFPWPGNVRELRNFIERSVILTRGHILNVPIDELIAVSSVTQSDDSIESKPALATNDKIFDRKIVITALRESNGVIAGPKGAAVKLGIKRTTLISRMQKMGIKSHDYLDEK